jgi:hypothetical protein
MTRSLSPLYSVILFCLISLPVNAAWAQNPSQEAQPASPSKPSETLQQAEQTQKNQTPSQPASSGQADSSKTFQNDRIFGVIPNYRTVEDEALAPTKLTPGEKFKLGLEDSFDYYAYPAAGIFAGIAMLQKQTPSFGQGAAGFGKYYGTAFADQTIGNMMSESVFPVMLRQDPRYFAMAKGGFWRRTRYSISREWITRNDSGKTGFNYSELVGNAVAVAISNAYYPDENRNFSNNMQKYGQQIGLDACFNILKEFWPDMRQKLFGK